MKDEILQKKEINLGLVLKSIIVFVLTTAAMIAIFAAAMYYFELDYKYSPVLGTVSSAVGAFVTAYFAAAKLKRKGLLTGFTVGALIFLIITVVSLIYDKGGITLNTLYHFVIIIISSLIGGILGVNKKDKRYI